MGENGIYTSPLCTHTLYYFVRRCGSGLSGEALSEAGHCWVGVDISRHMLGECGWAEREGERKGKISKTDEGEREEEKGEYRGIRGRGKEKRRIEGQR